MELFEFIDSLFSQEKWKNVSDTDKRKHFFMMNRYLSIKYPYQVLHLSLIKIDAPSVADYWHSSLSSLYSKTPGWVYAKTIKRKSKDKKVSYPSSQMIEWYCKTEGLSPKEFEYKEKFLGEKFISELLNEEKDLRSAGFFD